MIPKPILVPTIRALPGDGIAGHPPYVFMHTLLTDMEAAAAAPAKAKFLATAVAGKAVYFRRLRLVRGFVAVSFIVVVSRYC